MTDFLPKRLQPQRSTKANVGKETREVVAGYPYVHTAVRYGSCTHRQCLCQQPVRSVISFDNCYVIDSSAESIAPRVRTAVRSATQINAKIENLQPITLSRREPPFCRTPSVLRCGLAEDPDLDLMLNPLCLGGMVPTCDRLVWLPDVGASVVLTDGQLKPAARCSHQEPTV